MTDEELFLVYMHAALSGACADSESCNRESIVKFAGGVACMAIAEHRKFFPEQREGAECEN